MGNEMIRLGALDIVLPTAGERRCNVFHDLAGLLGLDFNAEAVERLTAEWKQRGKREKLDIDHEADFVSIHAGRDAILDAVVLLHELATPDVPRPTQADVAAARAALKRHRTPAPSPWGVGDVFAAPLKDGSFAVGQVLWEPALEGVRVPTVALIDHRVSAVDASIVTGGPGAVDLDELATCRAVAILHVLSSSLDDGRWRVLGRRPVTLDPFAGPCGHPMKGGATSWDGLEELANAWHGLAPWNTYFRTDHLDARLLRGIERPSTAHMLTVDERIARGLPGVDDPAYVLYARQFRGVFGSGPKET